MKAKGLKKESLEEALDRIVSKEPSKFWKESDERIKNRKEIEEAFNKTWLKKYISFNSDIGHAFALGVMSKTEKMYSESTVRRLLEVQRGNCYVAVLTETKDSKIASLAVSAPEPSGGQWVEDSILPKPNTI